MAAADASGGGGGIRSLVVLPLANVSQDPAQDYLSDGLTDSLIADLGALGTLRVTSRTTAMSYRGTNKTVPQIARELGVDAVVEGSVARAGNQVRFTVQLIEAAMDRHLSAQTYEGSLREVLVLQRAAVRAIAGGLRAQLTPRDEARLNVVRTVDPAVYEACLKGRYFWNKRNEDSLRKAIEHLEAAIRDDPTYAPAYALLANCYNQLGTVPLGIELNPSDALGHIWYANLLACRKRLDEAVAQVRKAEELDPLSMVVLANVGWTLAYAKAYAERLNGIAYLAVDPIWDAVRGDPRFQDLLRRARLRQ
jgi:TolB-like protein